MHLLYSLFLAAGAVLLLPYFVVRGLRRSESLASLRQRFGWLPREAHAPAGNSRGTIWIHAVSVGEALAALPLARRIRERFPEHRLVVSTTTVTGQQLARERLGFVHAVFYFPFDWAHVVRRALGAVQPALIVILETEIWPNFLREARRARVPVAFVNGRISERSFRRYQRAMRILGSVFRRFLARVLSDASLYLMQSKKDAERVGALGAPRERVVVAGNLKYDVGPAPASPLPDWLERELQHNNRRPLLIAGSIVPGEEEAILRAFRFVQGSWPRALLVLAPRKPERFDAAARLVEEAAQALARRSQLVLDGASPSSLEDTASVLLLDSVGELAGLYRLADAVFIGGSLVPAGGHNVLEPASFGRPPLFGPSVENFREAAEGLLRAGAAVQVENAEQLGQAWTALLQDPARKERMGASARDFVEANRGASERVLAHLASLLDQSARPGQGKRG